MCIVGYVNSPLLRSISCLSLHFYAPYSCNLQSFVIYEERLFGSPTKPKTPQHHLEKIMPVALVAIGHRLTSVSESSPLNSLTKELCAGPQSYHIKPMIRSPCYRRCVESWYMMSFINAPTSLSNHPKNHRRGRLRRRRRSWKEFH